MGSEPRVYITREMKFSENSHLFVDDEGEYRDIFLEELFADCYYGNPLGEIFRNNFAQYYGHLVGYEGMEPPDSIYDNVSSAREWVTRTFGLLYVSVATPKQRREESAEDCGKYRAVLRTFATKEQVVAYAPSELHAILLLVIEVYRRLSSAWCEKQFKPANALPV